MSYYNPDRNFLEFFNKFALILLIATFSFSKDFSHAKKSINILNLSANQETLIDKALDALNKADKNLLFKISFTPQEFDLIYPYLENADTTRESVRKFMNQYYIMDNAKMVERWVDRYSGRNFTLSRYEITGPIVDRKRFKYYKGVRIWVKEKGKEELELPFFRTLVFIDNGWKIWAYLDD